MDVEKKMDINVRDKLSPGASFLLLVFLLLALPVIVVLSVDGENISPKFEIIFGELIVAGTALIYLIVNGKESFKKISLKPVSVPNLGISVLLLYLVLPLIAILTVITSYYDGNTAEEALSRTSEIPLWYMIFAIGVMPAVFEELFFRGIIYYGIRERYGIPYAAFISSLTFGLFHMNLNQFAYAFVLGYLFVLVNEITGSIIPAVLLHLIINSQSVIASRFMSENMQSGQQAAEEVNMMDMLLVYGVMSIIGTMLAVKVIKWLAARCGKKEPLLMMLKNPISKSVEGNSKVDIPMATGIGVCTLLIILGLFSGLL